MLPSFTYVRAKSVADGVRQLAAPGARVHAGGTDLLGCLRDEVFTADKLVSLSRPRRTCAGSRPAPAGGLRIGALTTQRGGGRDTTINERYRGARAGGALPSPARSCATRARSAATSASGRAAGTSAASSTACGRAATLLRGGRREPVPRHLRRRRAASSSTRPTPRRRSSRSGARCGSRGRAAAASCRSRRSSCGPSQGRRRARRCSSGTRSSPRSCCRPPSRACAARTARCGARGAWDFALAGRRAGRC